MVGLCAVSPRPAAARAPVPWQATADLVPPQGDTQILKAAGTQSLVGSLGPGEHKVLFENLPIISGRYGV